MLGVGAGSAFDLRYLDNYGDIVWEFIKIQFSMDLESGGIMKYPENITSKLWKTSDRIWCAIGYMYMYNRYMYNMVYR